MVGAGAEVSRGAATISLGITGSGICPDRRGTTGRGRRAGVQPAITGLRDRQHRAGRRNPVAGRYAQTDCVNEGSHRGDPALAGNGYRRRAARDRLFQASDRHKVVRKTLQANELHAMSYVPVHCEICRDDLLPELELDAGRTDE